MAGVQLTLSNHGYKNWVKAGLSLKFTRDGIESFVLNGVDTFHQSVRAAIPGGATCQKCKPDDVVKGKTCSASVCNNIAAEVVNKHRYSVKKKKPYEAPSWKNTDVSQWWINSWQLAKCFMAQSGYSAVQSAVDTDLPGLLSVVINHIDFVKEVSDDLTKDENIFTKARDVRNEILHSPTFQVTDLRLSEYINTLKDVLSDQKCLAADQKAKYAIDKLNEIEKRSWKISDTDEALVRTEALRAIEEKKIEAIQAVQAEGQVQVDRVKKEYDDRVIQLNEYSKQLLREIKKVAGTEKDDIKHVARTEKDDIRQVAGTEKDDIKHVARTEKDDIRQVAGTEKDDIKHVAGTEKDDIRQVAGTEKDDIRQVAGTEKDDIKHEAGTEKDDIRQVAGTEKDDIKHVAGTEKDNIRQVAGTESKIAVETIRKITEDAVGTIKQKQKYDFQKDLIEFYKDDHLTVPINPLKPSETADIADMYAEPCMRQVDPHNKSPKIKKYSKDDASCEDDEFSESSGDDELIESYEDIFNKDAQLYKKIYITGDAGLGKSTLCQHLVATWCRANSEPTEPITKNEETMQKFDFVFYITLRDVTGSHNHVEEMIKDRLLKRLDESYSSILSKVLQTEHCLIILDGLDEWTPKNDSESSRCCTKGIPDRMVRRNCSIITTTRPWKLELLRLKTSEIDQQIELTGLDYSSSEQLIENAVTVLNRKYCKNKSANDFVEKLRKSNVAALRCIPVILKQLLCLWHGGKPFGNSECSIYSGMINLLFQLAEDKNLKGNQEYTNMKEGNASSELQFPKCFDGNKNCEELKPFVYALAKLSFETLFTHSKEESLVFEHSTAEMHGMSKLQIDISSEIGILSRSKILIDCNTESNKLSFIHKTFQEFLAGLYVSLNEETIGTITNICNSVEKMLEMNQVLVFISGMNPETAGKLSECICEMASRDGLIEHRQTLDGEQNFLYVQSQIQDTMISCVRESTNNGRQTKLKIEDIIIDKYDYKEPDTQHLENLIRSNSSNIRSLYIDLAPSCSLTEAIIQVDSLQKLSITQEDLFDDQFEDRFTDMQDRTAIPADLVYNLVCKSKYTLQCLVLSGFYPPLDMSGLSQIHFSSMIQPSSNITALMFSNVRLSHSQVECVMSFLSQSKHIRQIHLQGIYCTECIECENGECKYQLDLSGHTQLESLYLSGLHMSHNHVECPASFLSRSTHMREIHLENIQCTECEDGACRYQLDLSGHTQLKILDLNGLYVERVQVNTTSLVKLNITYLSTPGAVASIMNSVSNAPILQEIELNASYTIADPRDVDTLVAVISTLVQLKNIGLRNIDFGDRELRLPHSINIIHVTLVMVTMTSKSFQSFVASIPDTQHSVAIHLLNITIRPVDETTFNYVSHSHRFVVDKDLVDKDLVDKDLGSGGLRGGLKSRYFKFHTLPKGFD